MGYKTSVSKRKDQAFVVQDLPDGEYTMQGLSDKIVANADAVNKAVQADWPAVSNELLTDWAKSSRPVLDKGNGFPAVTGTAPKASKQ